MTVKERLHELVDRLPEAEALAAERYLEYLSNVGADPLASALAEAPLDDEPLTEEDLAEMQAARTELDRGEGRSWEEVRRRYADDATAFRTWTMLRAKASRV